MSVKSLVVEFPSAAFRANVPPPREPCTPASGGDVTQHALDEEWLEELDDATRERVSGDDDADAVVALLQLVESLPPMSSTLRPRSAYLGAIRARFGAWSEAWDESLQPRLLLAIAETAFVAHETTAGMAAAHQAIELAEDIGHADLAIIGRSLRLPYLQGDDADAEAEAIADELDALGAASATLLARVHMARAAWLAAGSRWDEVRVELVSVGRLALPHDERIVWYAFASQLLLARMALRGGQRAAAAKSLIEAARVAAELDAHAELANLQTVVAAFAVRTGSFEAAMAHAASALAALAAAQSQHQQPDPWLGVPVDVSAERDVAGAIRAVAEAVIAAQERGDRVDFLIAVSALVAYYLASDRAPEALDALSESQVAAEEMGDHGARQLLHSLSESLLRYMGVLA